MKFYHDDGKLVQEPFQKFEAYHSLGRNHFYRVFIPVLDGVEIVEDEYGNKIPADGFSVVKSNTSGHFLVVPDRDESDDILAFIGDQAGYRGNVSLVRDDTTARVLYSDSTHASCRGNVTVVAVVKPGQRIVVHSDGRRSDRYRVYENVDGEIIVTEYGASEYEVAQEVQGQSDSGQWDALRSLQRRVILSTALILEEGTFEAKTLSLEEAQEWVDDDVENYCGHQTVKLLGLKPDTERRQCDGYDEALCLRAKERLEFGREYSIEEIRKIGVEITLIKKVGG
jgi:hypothetical protein